MSIRRLTAIARLLIREMRTSPEHTYGPFHVGVRAARGSWVDGRPRRRSVSRGWLRPVRASILLAIPMAVPGL